MATYWGLKHLVDLLFLWELRLRLPTLRPMRADGFIIVDATPEGQRIDTFGTAAVAALKKLQNYDPRRFARVQREVKFVYGCYLNRASKIRLSRSGCMAIYRRICKIIMMDRDVLNLSANPEVVLKAYGCALVHEATHGLLYSRHIPYTYRTRDRIETLCLLEEARFANMICEFRNQI